MQQASDATGDRSWMASEASAEFSRARNEPRGLWLDAAP